jgi:hypothetical protein
MLPNEEQKSSWIYRGVGFVFILLLAPIHYLLAIAAALICVFIFTAYGEAVAALTLAALLYGATPFTQIQMVFFGFIGLLLIERIKQKLIVYS